MAPNASRHTASLAVLPFENLSADGGPQQDYFSRGFVDDVITDLSRFPELMVMAPHSSESADSQKLDVDYVLKGSLRRDPEKLRLSAQLFNQRDGSVVWGDRFDADMTDLFGVQDEITTRVVGAVSSRLSANLLATSRRKPKTEISAYDYWLQGSDCLKQGTLAADQKARGLFQEALRQDNNYSRAYLGLSLSHFNEWSCRLWERWDENETRAYEYAERANQLDESDHYAHMVLGRVLLFRREFERAEHHIEQALALNANDADCLVQVGMALSFLGHGERAQRVIERSFELNPYHDSWYYAFAAVVAFNQQRFERALELGKKAPLSTTVDLPAYVAAAYHHLGEREQAREHVDLYLNQFREKIVPGREPEAGEALRWVEHVNPYRDPKAAARLAEGLRAAGLVDGQPPASIETPDDLAAFCRVGSLWRMTFQGKNVHLPQAKGFQDIALLLARPGQELHCSELMGQMDRTGADPVIDSAAKADYETRIRELEADLAEAEQNNDVGRKESIRVELDALLEHLNQALGLGGRSRKLGAPAERARSAVTQRIRAAIRKIEAVHQGLAEHLEHSLKTGTFCSYHAETAPDWQL